MVSSNSSIQFCGFKYSYLILIIFKQVCLTLTSSTTLDQSGSESNGNEEVFYNTQNSRIGVLPLDAD